MGVLLALAGLVVITLDAARRQPTRTTITIATVATIAAVAFTLAVPS